MDTLDIGLDSQLTLVLAPPRYGKTQLLADWFEKRLPRHKQVRALWVDVVDPTDLAERIRVQLWRFFSSEIEVDALRSGMPRATHETQSVDADIFAKMDATQQRTELLELLDLSVDLTFLITFDLEQVGFTQESLADCGWLLQKARNLRIWVAGPTDSVAIDPAIELAIDTHIVEADQLLFNPAEVAEVADRLDLVLSPGECVELQEMTNGVPQLVRETLYRAKHSWSSSETAATMVRLRKALRDSIELTMKQTCLFQADPQALSSLALPPFLTLNLADEIVPNGKALELILAIQQCGFGHWEYADDVRRFAMIDIFRTFLQEGLSLDSEEVARIRRSTAAEMEALDLPIEACEEYLILGDEDGMERVIQQHFPWRLWVKRDQINEMMARMPQSAYVRKPLFLGFRAAVIYWSSGVDDLAFDELRRIVDSVETSGQTFDEREELLFVAAKIFLLTSKDSPAHIDETHRILVENIDVRRGATRPLLDLISCVALNHLASLRIQLGQYATAEAVLDQLLEMDLPERAAVMKLRAKGLAALAAVLRGDVTGAQRIVLRCQSNPYWSIAEGSYWLRFMHLAEAYIALESLDYSKALWHIAGLKSDANEYEDNLLIVHASATAYLLGGYAAEGLAAIEGFQERSADLKIRLSSHQLDMLNAVKVDLLLSADRFSDAKLALAGEETTSRTYRMSLNRFRIKIGDSTRSLSQARSHLASDGATIRERTEDLVIQAIAANALGDLALAQDSWRQAMDLHSMYGVTLPFWVVPGSGLVTSDGYVFGSALPEPLSRPEVLSRLTSPKVPRLTKREGLVLERYVSTSSIAEIAAALSVSPNTVKSQIRSVYKKLGVSGRGPALAKAIELGILKNPSSPNT